jgi:hypothetical protein
MENLKNSLLSKGITTMYVLMSINITSQMIYFYFEAMVFIFIFIWCLKKAGGVGSNIKFIVVSTITLKNQVLEDTIVLFEDSEHFQNVNTEHF